MANILTISASPSPLSKTTTARRFVDDRLTAGGHDVQALDVRDLPPAALLAGDAAHPGLASIIGQVDRADGLVVATPVYKASYSGLLKTLLDLLPERALAGKVVLPIATGGTLAHVLVLDYALRPVLAALGASEVVSGFFLLDTRVPLTGGVPVLARDAEEDLRYAVDRFTEALSRASSVVAHNLLS